MKESSEVQMLSRATVMIFLLCARPASTEEDLSVLRSDIQVFKNDPRGPYQSIRWFCPDGSVIPARDRCAQPGGWQHALVKDRVAEIAATHHVFLGPILTGTSFDAFLDRERRYARVKQFQIESFLRANDDGWIHRRAQYYRGAIQAEDERAWGQAFLTWMVSQNVLLEEQYFLVRQAVKDLPHGGDTDGSSRMRALAREAAALEPAFRDLRVKIHGRPDAEDAERVRAFLQEHETELSPRARDKLGELENELEELYRRAEIPRLERYLPGAPVETPIGEQLRVVLSGVADEPHELTELLWRARTHIAEVPLKHRLALVELTIDVEAILFRVVGRWHPRTVRELLQKTHVLARAAAACGFIEPWEWERLQNQSSVSGEERSTNLSARVDATDRGLAWAVGMVSAVYGDVVERFSTFEPSSREFIDDRIRGSILLRLGEAADELYQASARTSGHAHELMGLTYRGGVRGLNPGFAVGELVVLDDVPPGATLSPERIYVLRRAPDELEPVAGIATVHEGNAVSHVQLLARNLGIPNAVLSWARQRELAPYSGTTVFFAVSPRGKVVMKPADAMSREEARLFQSKDALASRVRVPTDQLALDTTDLLELATLRASHSGVVCGPKAANLGELSAYFPGSVPEGLVIPFAEFHRHLRQTMPGTTRTYWAALAESLSGEDADGTPERLATIRASLRSIPFLPDFTAKLRRRFAEVFDRPMGSLRVFVRSDTNMEDLDNFTGAGLNLTVAHIEDEARIFQAIRDVWASPFSERSYLWRRTVLDDPLAVFPSVLITPSVPVDKSGVLITSGASRGEAEDLMVAVNWGGGGAVAGQSAETHLLRADGSNVLLSPSREPELVALSPSRDVETRPVTFERAILSSSELDQIRELAAALGERFDGALDVELGFENGRLWLFQARPFVQNESAHSARYLESLDVGYERRANARVDLDAPLDR